MSRIRVKTVGDMGYRTEVVYVDDEGNETDISQACTGVDISIRVTDVNRVTCHAIMDMGTFEGELNDVVLNIIPPDRIPDVIERLKNKAIGTPDK